MSERERWIVYPLLFLALGVALRDELFNRTWSKNVVCERLVIVEDDPAKLQLGPQRIAEMGPKGGSIDEVTKNGMLRVDTVWARTVVADNFTSRDGRMNLVPYLLRMLGTPRPKAAPQRQLGPRPPAVDDTPENQAVGDQIVPQAEQVPVQ